MRHKRVTNHFGRRPGPHKALLRGLVDSMVKYERIRTTVVKAKELRRHVERAVTKGKVDSVHSRRILLSDYPNKETVKKLVSDLGPRFKDRAGGYTRIIKAGNRPGDNAPMAYIEFVDYKLPDPTEEKTPEVAQHIVAKRQADFRRRKRKLQKQDRKIARRA